MSKLNVMVYGKGKANVTFTCSKPTIETLKKGVKYVRS